MAYSTNLSFAGHALSHAPVAVIVLDHDRRIAWTNQAAEEYFGFTGSALIGLGAEQAASALHVALFDPKDTLHLPATSEHPARWLQCWLVNQTAENGATHSVHYYFDVTDLQVALEDRARLSEELAQHTTRDSMTGLPNRLALLHGLEPLVSRSRRYQNPLSVVRLRIDNLAELEDEHGKGSGDTAMIAVSHMLKDQMRWADLVGRFDTDEFLLVLPETGDAAARQLSNKLALRLEDMAPKGGDGHPMSLSAQFGVAAWVQGDDRARLLRRARAALEDAAAGGG